MNEITAFLEAFESWLLDDDENNEYNDEYEC